MLTAAFTISGIAGVFGEPSMVSLGSDGASQYRYRETAEEAEPENKQEDGEDKNLEELINKQVEQKIREIFKGIPTPQFQYQNKEAESTPEKAEKKSFTAREIAEIITGGN